MGIFLDFQFLKLTSYLGAGLFALGIIGSVVVHLVHFITKKYHEQWHMFFYKTSIVGGISVAVIFFCFIMAIMGV